MVVQRSACRTRGCWPSLNSKRGSLRTRRPPTRLSAGPAVLPRPEPTVARVRPCHRAPAGRAKPRAPTVGERGERALRRRPFGLAAPAPELPDKPAPGEATRREARRRRDARFDRSLPEAGRVRSSPRRAGRCPRARRGGAAGSVLPPPRSAARAEPPWRGDRLGRRDAGSVPGRPSPGPKGASPSSRPATRPRVGPAAALGASAVLQARALDREGRLSMATPSSVRARGAGGDAGGRPGRRTASRRSSSARDAAEQRRRGRVRRGRARVRLGDPGPVVSWRQLAALASAESPDRNGRSSPIVSIRTDAGPALDLQALLSTALGRSSQPRRHRRSDLGQTLLQELCESEVFLEALILRMVTELGVEGQGPRPRDLARWPGLGRIGAAIKLMPAEVELMVETGSGSPGTRTSGTGWSRPC